MFYLQFYNLGLQSITACVTLLDWSDNELLVTLTNHRRVSPIMLLHVAISTPSTSQSARQYAGGSPATQRGPSVSTATATGSDILKLTNHT